MSPLGLQQLVAGIWAVDGRIWALGMSRGRRPFSEKAVARLNAILPHVRAALRANHAVQCSPNDPSTSAERRSEWRLTPIQQLTAEYAIKGLANKEIAALMGRSPHTVRNALSEVFDRVGVSSRTQLAFAAARIGARDDGLPRTRSNEGPFAKTSAFEGERLLVDLMKNAAVRR